MRTPFGGGSVGRLTAAAGAALFAATVLASAASAGNASSWRATIAGNGIAGGAGTLLLGDGRGSISVSVDGFSAGAVVLVSVVTAPCGTDSGAVITFGTIAGPDGRVKTRHALLPSEAALYAGLLSARTAVSIRAATPDARGCGDQLGNPRVGTGRLQGKQDGLYRYDLRYPVVTGIDASAAAAVNEVLARDAHATADTFVQDAKNVADLADPVGFPNRAAQTFSVSLARPTLLSVTEHYVPEIVGAPHGDEQFVTYTFDLTTGKPLALADLFRPGSDFEAVITREAERLLRPKLRGFAGAVADHHEAWAVATSGLQIAFAQLQGFAVPIVTITIPWSALRGVLDPGSPVARVFGGGM